MTIFQRLDSILKGVKHPVVLECGTCDGYHSNLMLKAIKSVDRPYTFICFEPVQELHEQILMNLKGHMMYNKGVICVLPFAVGSKEGQATLYKSGGEKIKGGKVVDRYYGSSSIRKPALVKQSFPDMTFEERNVQVVTLDSLNITETIDFIWADIQGAEVDMITGGMKTLARTRYLYTEYENGSYEGQIGLWDMLAMLPGWEVVEDYGGDVLLRNTKL